MSEFMFNKGDRALGHDGITFEIMAAFEHRGENYYAIRSDTGSIGIREESTCLHWKLISKYIVGDIWISADGSKAFMVSRTNPTLGMQQITNESEQWISVAYCEGRYGPLARWDSPRG